MSKSKFTVESNTAAVMGQLRKALEAGTLAGALIAEGQVKALTRVDTGALRDSVTHQSISKGTFIGQQVGSALDYAVYEEFGTGEFAENGAGRKGGWVYTDAAGDTRFTKGTQPQRMFRNGFKRSRSRIVKAVAKRLGEVGK